jgi:hypothetical protein
MKLTEYIKVNVRTSPIDVYCEVTPGHYSKHYVIVSFEKPAIANGQPVMNRTELRVCPACFSQFAYDIAQIGREVSLA